MVNLEKFKITVLILYFLIFIAGRAWFYPTQALGWYKGMDDDLIGIPLMKFVFIMKPMLNKAYNKKRPVGRNIIFNLIRCQFKGIFYSLVFGMTINWENQFWNTCFLTLVTYLLERYVYNHWIKRLRLVWAILMTELVTMLGISLLSLLNRLETISKGNIFMVVLCMFYEIHVTRGGWWIEDMVYGDMN